MAYKILTFVPAFGHTLTAATFLATHQLHAQLMMRGMGCGIATHSFPDIAELRAIAATIFLDTTDFTHLLFIDADMSFAPDLVLDMLLLDEPLVGTIYPQRKLPLSWAGSGSGLPTTERRGNFMKVEGVGMGCTLIRRDCLALMSERMPHLTDTRLALHPAKDLLMGAGCRRLFRAFEKLDIPERGIISEDLSFCIRWAQLGGTTWAAVGHKISHVGQFDYSGRFLDQVDAEMAKHAAEQKQPSAASAGGVVAVIDAAVTKPETVPLEQAA